MAKYVCPFLCIECGQALKELIWSDKRAGTEYCHLSWVDVRMPVDQDDQGEVVI